MARVWKFGDAITTDDILPGKFAPFMVGEDSFHRYAFAHIRPEFADEVKPGDVLVGGSNWGLGSSREYAPEALKRLGVVGIVAKSFARIHYRNLINLGLVPFEAPHIVDALHDRDKVELDVTSGMLTRGGTHHELPSPPDFVLEALKAGSMMDYYLTHRRFPGSNDGGAGGAEDW